MYTDEYQDNLIDDADNDIYINDDQLDSNDIDFENKEQEGEEDEVYFVPIEHNEYTTEYLDDGPNFYDTFRAVADARK